MSESARGQVLRHYRGSPFQTTKSLYLTHSIIRQDVSVISTDSSIDCRRHRKQHGYADCWSSRVGLGLATFEPQSEVKADMVESRFVGGCKPDHAVMVVERPERTTDDIHHFSLIQSTHHTLRLSTTVHHPPTTKPAISASHQQPTTIHHQTLISLLIIGISSGL